MGLLLLICLTTGALAYPQQLDDLVEGSGGLQDDLTSENLRSDFAQPRILRQDFESDYEGSFSYGFESSNGISVEASGGQRQIGDGIGSVQRGSYSYTSPEGRAISISWVADEGGFQATGEAIPAAPAFVQRILQNVVPGISPRSLAEPDVKDSEGLDQEELLEGSGEENLSVEEESAPEPAIAELVEAAVSA